MGGHLRVRWREHGDYWGTATRIRPEDVESVRAELHLDDLGDVFEFRDLEHLDEVLTGNHLNFLPKVVDSGDGSLQGAVAVGDTVTITTRGGKSWDAVVDAVVWSGDNVAICATRSLDRVAPKAAAPTYRPVRGQDYCGYPCPVTRQRCTASNPCHDCQ